MQTDKTSETHNLISSEKVDGTAVYGRDGEHIGSVKSLMIEKRGGRVTDAVVSVGGFLGLGEKYHSLPWSTLKYDTDVDGYRLDVTEDQLRSGPTFDNANRDTALDRGYQARVYSHYGVNPYW